MSWRQCLAFLELLSPLCSFLLIRCWYKLPNPTENKYCPVPFIFLEVRGKRTVTDGDDTSGWVAGHTGILESCESD